jgi:chemotaxis protein MotB
MIRRRQDDETHNHERWVISYADFITLLFAFFVVMYSISSVNEGKYKVLSDSLVEVFNTRSRTLDPLQSGDQPVRRTSERLISLPHPGDFPSNEDFKYTVEGLFEEVDYPGQAGEDSEVRHLSRLSDQLALSLQNLISEGMANIQLNRDWIEIDIQSSVLFDSGSAIPSAQAKQIVLRVAELLQSYENPIHVEGFTDNVPIQTDQFPSNWELSAFRSAAVVRLFEIAGIQPARLAAVGYGEHRPVADNETEEGRSRNRRVALIISRLKPKEEAPASDAVRLDYRIGAGIEPGPAVDARDPASRQRARSNQIPLKIIDLERGGTLFSSEPGERQNSTSSPSP